MGKLRDLTSQKFGRFTVVKRSHNVGKHIMWECLCECGNINYVSSTNLLSGQSTSCGCFRKEFMSDLFSTHGKSKTSTHITWKNIHQRCYNPNCTHYKYYGGRGITMCDRWLNSFENFLFDMGEKPEGLSIDRIDSNGDYTPENCRWETSTVQSRNQRVRKDNKTGIKGVKRTPNNKYTAYIKVNKKKITLGTFEDLELAEFVRSEAELHYWY